LSGSVELTLRYTTPDMRCRQAVRVRRWNNKPKLRAPQSLNSTHALRRGQICWRVERAVTFLPLIA